MSNFSQYMNKCMLLEATFQEIAHELNNVNYKTFMNLPTNKIFKPRMLLQIYIALLIIGINKSDIDENKMIIMNPQVKKDVQNLMVNSDYGKEFSDVTQGITDEEFINLESDKIKNVIEHLTNKYGEQFDAKLVRV